MRRTARPRSKHNGLRLVVRSLSATATRGVLHLGWLRCPCALGRSGRRAMKREGDGATPVGSFRLVRVLWRAERGPRLATRLPVTSIQRHHGWCDAPSDRNYNRPVRHPYPASAEHLWREDRLYDLVVTLDHNQRPRIRGHGSAVFMHVAAPGMTPTAGCIALGECDLRRLLSNLRRGARLVVPA